jgi:hypothetical protein
MDWREMCSVSPGVAYSVSLAQTSPRRLPGASVFGQSVTITATVSVLAPGSGTATDSVIFCDGAIEDCHRCHERRKSDTGFADNTGTRCR